MAILSTILFGLAGLVNFAPVVGILSAGRVQNLYGITLGDPNLVILMRHRAALLGIIGAILIVSAFHLPLRPLAFAAGMFSMIAFIAIAHLVGGYNEELRRVILIDAVAIVLLGAGWIAHTFAAGNASAA